jgi:hypothetical protein
MKHFSIVGLSVLALGLASSQNSLHAQDAGEVQSLKKQLQQMQENFERSQREQKAQMDALTQKLEALSKAPPVATTPAEPVATLGYAHSEPPKKFWSPADPIRISKGNAYADLGIVGTFAAGTSTASDIEGGTQLGGHDPNQRGFTVQGAELNLQGAVDPYFRGNANILFSVDSGGESFMELEEAWLETTALPWGLSLRAGQILTDFGHINASHPHTWAFVDSPLVNGRFFGADGLRNPGARLSWLMPLPFFSEFSIGVQNSQGETAASFRDEGSSLGFRPAENNRGVKGVGDLLFTPRLSTSFDVTDTQTLLLGASAAFGPNSSGSSGDPATQIYGVDAYWKWKPANAEAGFPFVSWQSEAMLRRYQLGAFDWDLNGNGVADTGEIISPNTALPAVLGRETLTDWGFYSQVLYGFRKGWVAGLRFDYVNGNRADYERLGLTLDGESLGRDPQRNERWRISPNLTWYPTEFTKLRLQYHYDDRRDIGQDHSVWLQFEFLLGAHAAHKF